MRKTFFSRSIFLKVPIHNGWRITLFNVRTLYAEDSKIAFPRPKLFSISKQYYKYNTTGFMFTRLWFNHFALFDLTERQRVVLKLMLLVITKCLCVSTIS